MAATFVLSVTHLADFKFCSGDELCIMTFKKYLSMKKWYTSVHMTHFNSNWGSK